jgi:hypothetical protein
MPALTSTTGSVANGSVSSVPNSVPVLEPSIPKGPWHLSKPDAPTTSTVQESKGTEVSKNVRDPAPNKGSPISFPILGMKKWQGRVTEVSDGILTAEMTPLDHEGPTLLADFNLDLLAPDDEGLCPGDMVYLTVRTVPDGPLYRTGVTTLRRARLGRWSRQELDNIRSRARMKLESFLQNVD